MPILNLKIYLSIGSFEGKKLPVRLITIQPLPVPGIKNLISDRVKKTVIAKNHVINSYGKVTE